MRSKIPADYTVYSRKTTLPVAFGTPAECARTLNIKKSTFLSMASRATRNRGRQSLQYIIIREDPEIMCGTGD